MIAHRKQYLMLNHIQFSVCCEAFENNIIVITFFYSFIFKLKWNQDTSGQCLRFEK